MGRPVTELAPSPDRPRVAASACLLGAAVRWDGRDKRAPLVAERLAGHVDLLGVCPELEVGMGVPREPVQVVARGASLRLEGVESKRDWTAAVDGWAAARLASLTNEGPLDGWVLKARSPSCALGDAPRHGATAGATGPGIFAELLLDAWPGLPVIDEVQLEDPVRRDAWLSTVFARATLRRAEATARARGDGLRGLHDRVAAQLRTVAPGAEGTLRRLVAREATLYPGDRRTGARASAHDRWRVAAFAALRRPPQPERVARALASALRALGTRGLGPEGEAIRGALGRVSRGEAPAWTARAPLRRLAEGTLVAGWTLVAPYPPALEG